MTPNTTTAIDATNSTDTTTVQLLDALGEELRDKPSVKTVTRIGSDETAFLVTETTPAGITMDAHDGEIVETFFNETTERIEHYIEPMTAVTDGGAITQSPTATETDTASATAGPTTDTVKQVRPYERRSYSSEQLLEQLRTCQNRHGSDTWETFEADPDFASAATVTARFGSWRLARSLALPSTDSGRPKKYTTPELLDQLRTCATRHGECTKTTFDDDPEFASSRTVYNRFGDWEQALHIAGV